MTRLDDPDVVGGGSDGSGVSSLAKVLGAVAAALVLLVPLVGGYGGQLLDYVLSKPRAETTSEVEVQTTATKHRRDLYERLRTADGVLIRSEESFRGVMAATKHPRPGAFEVDVAKLREAREAFYAAKDQLSTYSSTRVFCAVGRLSKSHAKYTKDLVSASIEATRGGTYSRDQLATDSRDVGTKSRVVLNRIREEGDKLAVESTTDPIGCRKAGD